MKEKLSALDFKLGKELQTSLHFLFSSNGAGKSGIFHLTFTVVLGNGGEQRYPDSGLRTLLEITVVVWGVGTLRDLGLSKWRDTDLLGVRAGRSWECSRSC